jgi:hypothetical protein
MEINKIELPEQSCPLMTNLISMRGREEEHFELDWKFIK